MPVDAAAATWDNTETARFEDEDVAPVAAAGEPPKTSSEGVICDPVNGVEAPAGKTADEALVEIAEYGFEYKR